MQQKYELETRLTNFWHKNEKKISLNFIFVFELLRFRHLCPNFLLSKFASQIKLIQSVVGVRCQTYGDRVPGPRFQGPTFQGRKSQVLGSQVSGSQGSSSQSLGPWVPGPGSLGPRFWVLGFQSPGSWVSGSRVPSPSSRGPGSQVSGPDFRLCLFWCWSKWKTQYEFFVLYICFMT